MTVAGHITWGPTKELKRQSAGIKWCFSCRKHLEHTAILLDYHEPSYYEPIWVLRCERCNHDCTRFPGYD